MEVEHGDVGRQADEMQQLRAERDDLRRQLADLQQRNARLWALAREDPLTGLANRHGLGAMALPAA
jgi:cell division protein FtsB